MANIDIAQHFETQHLSQMELSSYASVAIGASIRDTVAAMASEGNSCAFVMSGSDIAGIFTERDVAAKVVHQPEVWDAPIEDVMTPDPYTVSGEQTAMDALQLMNHRRFRNVPVRSDDGELLGNLTHYDLIRLASAFLEEKTPVGAEFVPEHSLLFVNFTGLMVSKPVTFEPTASLAEVIDAMTYEETGLVSIVDERGAIIGEFTEHDIFTKVACQIEDLKAEAVGDWMTTEIAATSPRTTISEGVHVMAEMGHRYLVLLSETNRPTGVATFRDIAEYIETAFSV